MAMTNKNKKDKYTIEAEERYGEQYKSDLKASNQLYDKQVKSTNKDYDTQIFEQGRAYEDQYRENAVQKEINKRQVSESMANLGLRDSGLNRTQQTAVQLSYGNNKANIDRQRQSGIDSLNYSRRQALDTIELNRANTNAEMESTYNNNVRTYADTLRENSKSENKSLVLGYLEMGAEPPKEVVAASGMSEADVDAYRNYYKKALQKSQTTVKSNKNNENEVTYPVYSFSTGKDSEGNGTYYAHSAGGKKFEYPAGTNPYTNISVTLTTGFTTQELQQVGVWNGYQPKAVKENGQLLKLKQYKSEKGAATTEYQGHRKRVWKTDDGRLWVWDDYAGNYVRAQDNGDGTFDIYVPE